MSLARDVARRAGVSTATVSRVLNGNGYVRAELRERVEEAVRALGYESNALACSLRRGRTRILGLVIANVANAFSSVATRAAEECASQAGYHVVLCPTEDDPGREHRHLALLRHLRADGLIATPCGENDEQIADLAARGVPIVLLGRRLRQAGAALDTVVADAAGGSGRAIEHLIGLGHRRIGILPGPLRLSSARDRLAGYWRAVTRQGLPFDDALVEESLYSVEAGCARVHRLMRLRDRPSALFVSGDLLVLGALQALREDGLRVPEDVALLGFDDANWAPYIDPPLTVVAQPLREMALTATRLLLERIEAGSRLPPREVVLPTRFVARKSCGGGTGEGGNVHDPLDPWMRAVSE